MWENMASCFFFVLYLQLDGSSQIGLVIFFFPNNHWTLQWKGLNLYSSGVFVINLATFEGSGFLGSVIISSPK